MSIVCVIDKDFRSSLFQWCSGPAARPACIIHSDQTGSSELVVLNLATVIGPPGNNIQQHRYWLGFLNIHQGRGHCIWESFFFIYMLKSRLAESEPPSQRPYTSICLHNYCYIYVRFVTYFTGRSARRKPYLINSPKTRAFTAIYSPEYKA